MFYDAIERAAAVLTANFATDLAALIAAKAEAGLQSSVMVHKRRTAQLIVGKSGNALPAIGVYGITALTESRNQDNRDSVVSLGIDYVARGPDDEKVAKQVELAVEAVLRSIDRMAGDAAGTLAAGLQANSVSVTLTPVALGEGQETFEQMATIVVPLLERDTGLS